MQAWVWLVLIILASVISAFTLGVPSLILFIYFVVKGKSIAWNTRRWGSFDEFLSVQKIWDLWGKILLIIYIVVIVVGIFSSMVLVAVSGARVKARDAKVKSDLRTIKSALSTYKNDNGKCPDKLNLLVPATIKEIPIHPVAGQSYEYKVDGSKCVIYAQLENSEDVDLGSDYNPGNGNTYDLVSE